MKDKVRLGLIGLGNIGSYHADYLRAGKVSRCELAAVCDADERRLSAFSDVKTFADSGDMIRSGEVDAVIIGVPHYYHTPVGIDALGQGIHVLMEKPISVHKADCERLIAAHTDKSVVFAAMFNLRTDPRYKKVKQLIENGDLGDLARVTWIVTNWYRTEAYYASGGWRATWRGEGGGVLLNQCPHQLDLLQWICGMPSKVRGFCGFGVWHDIEVEDRVTAYLEYPNGATGVFITTTGEAPGTDHLEIAGDRGMIVVEDGRIIFTRNEVPMREFSRTSPDGFCPPDVWNIEIPVVEGGGHREITQNFVDAILDGTPLIAPAEEGIHSVELGNTMLYSSLTDQTVTMPLDGTAYEAELKKLIENSRYVKEVKESADGDMSKSFRQS